MSAPAAQTGGAPAEGRIRSEPAGEGGRVREIVIDRPRKLNGFTPEMLRQLAEAFTAAEQDEAVRVLLVRAEGPHFTAGLDLSVVKIGAPLAPAGLVDPFGLRPPLRKKPLVVAVKGLTYTLGIELLLAADVGVAASDARFAQKEVQRGLMPFGGATLRFHARAGWGNAMRWLLTGDDFDAAEALRCGLVQEMVEPGKERERALFLAGRIAAQAPLAVGLSLESARLAEGRGPQAAVSALEGQLAQVVESDDLQEGIRSFIEKRPGRFTGR